MKNRFLLSILLVAASVTTCISFCACNKIDIKEYPPAPTAYKYQVDGSIALSSAETAPMGNLSRGFRGETYITLGRDEAYPDSNEPYMQKLDNELKRLEADGIKIMQVYVYLIEYYNTSIPDSAFAQLKEYFQVLEQKGIKILLRFAYETNEGQKTGPKTSDIERHCAQLKEFFKDNLNLFNKTVYALQMGLIGLWGEGHGSVHRHNVGRVIKAVADMTPKDTPIMVRTPQMLSQVPKDIEDRFGMHEDYVIGYNDPWVAIATDDKNYYAVTNKCKYAVTDGEMPWGRAGVPIDTIGSLKTAADFAMTSFSLAHNYTEEGEHNLKAWQSEYLTEQDLKDNNLPYNPALLTNGKISAFDYLKYHLGYQLVASNLEIKDGRASFMITNYGFACPYGYDMKIFVDGKQVTTQEEYSWNNLTQFGQSVFSFAYDGGDIEVEFVNRRDSADTIEFFNDVPYENGRNVIYRAK
ncbi:MAG: DUF4874 domain-containing protein [Clostridia bacterium]|nr:DUF4874 domain-containing protein [Clostridia bacterium]